MVAEATTGDPTSNFKGSRVGIVSFANTATADAELTTDRGPLRTALASLQARGDTNHEAGTQLDFPSPWVEVTCAAVPVYPEPCPEPTAFTVPGCRDAARITLADAVLQGLGRIVQVDVTLKAVCPGKQVAASVILVELAPDGTELPRGAKHILVPAQTGTGCQDLTLKCVQFSLPEGLDATGAAGSICDSRKFAARVIANYVNTDFACCPPQTQTL